MSSKQNTLKKKALQDMPLEELEIGNVIYTTRLTSKFRNRRNWARPDERLVTAVIPGTIQKIMVKVGERVEAGKPMLILEAMKMEMPIVSDDAGTVKAVNCKEGDAVEADVFW